MADYQYLRETGVIVPDTAETLEQVRSEFRTAFGTDLDLSAETPQGVLVTAETQARDTVIRNNADLANQINPNLAGGVFLDAIWQLTGGQRFGALPSVIRNAILTGTPGTLIPAGSRAAVSSSDQQFQLIGAVVLDNSGSGVGVFQSVNNGAIAAAIGALDQIVTGVLGWETVSNPYPAELGALQESDIASRVRRRLTLALQGVALPEAIVSGVYSLPGVRSALFRENFTNVAVTIEDVVLSPHSVYLCVDGGIDNDIALMLLRKKSLGAGMNGNTTIMTTEPVSGQVYPVQFSRPDAVPIFARVTVRGGSAFSDVPALVREAILAYSRGEQEGEPGFTVGEDVSAFELASAVNRAHPTIFVQNVEISQDGATYSSAAIPITISEIATILSSNITVTVL